MLDSEVIRESLYSSPELMRRPVSELSYVFGAHGVEIRAAISHLVVDGGEPIVSLPTGGFKLAECPEDTALEVATLRSRARKILRRAAILDGVSAALFTQQLALEFLDAEAEG